mgnify:CR=1 FL=1
MAIKSNALAENKAAILAEDGGTIYATLQMRHGKESEMDESKFVPAEIGVATDTKKAVIAFGPGDTKEFAFKDDIPDQDYNNLENKPSIGGVELSGNKSLKQLGIQPKGEYITKIPAEYVTDTELTEKLKSYPTKEEQAEELEKKLDKNQGAENTGKALVVGEDGTVKPGEIPIKVDDTLSQTGQAADAEKVGARLHEIDAVKLRGPVETVSGEILQIENPAEQPPVGMRVYGKAEQNTTTGAQLLNAPDKTNKIFGVTMSVSGGIASFSGTLSSNNATFWFIGSYNGVDVVMTLPAGKYYLQNCSMQTLGNSALKTGAITSETEIQITGVAYTYTNSSPKTIYPMINAGSKALPWEPYTGGQPSPSPEYPQEIEIPGSDKEIRVELKAANLIPLNENEEKTQYGVTFKQNADGSVTINGQNTGEANSVYNLITNDALLARQFAKIGTLYLSGNKAGTNVTLQCWNYDGNNSAVKDNGEGISFVFTNVTAPYNIALVVPTNEIVDNVTINPMLNAGTTALPWAPYKDQSLTLSTPNGLPGIPVKSGGNYTDEDGQQWVCDEIDFVRGKYIQRIGKTNFVETSWIRNNSGQYYTNKDFDKYKIDSLVICSHMLGKDTGASENTMFVNNNGNIRLNYKNTTDTIEYIADIMNDAVMYGILAEPIETDLSPEEIAAYRALKLYNPVTNVFTAESLMPGIAVDYVPETERYIEKSINDNTQKAPAIVEKASGEMLNITESSDLGLKGLKVFGKSGQLKTTGAQLFDASKLESKQSDGITITNNGNGSFTINGTSTGYPGTSYNIALENGMYYISTKDEVDVKNIFRARIRKNDSYEDKGVGTSFEIDGTEDQVQIYIQADKGFSFNNVVIYPMLNAGSTALPWEPYTGRKPSPSPEYPQEIKIPGSDGEIGVKVTGAQLLDFRKAKGNENAEGVAYTVLENGSVLRKGTATGEAGNCWFLGDYEIIPSENTTIMTLEAGKTYYIKDCVVYSNTKVLDTGIINISIEEYPDGFKVTGVRNEKQNIKNTYNDIIYPMIAESSTPLPWEPYELQPLTLSTPNGLPGIPVDSGGNYTDESGQQWICDEVDFERGKYIQRVIQKENLTFTKNGDYTVEGSELYFCSVPEFSKTGNVAYIGTGMSTHMRYTNTVLDKNEVGFYIGYGGIWARIKDVGDLDTFNEKLQDAVFYFTYTNMSPIEIDLTEEQLKSYRSLYTNYSTTNVFTDSDPQVGLGMEYVADTKSYIDKKFEELQKALVNTNTQVLNKVIMEDIEHV